MSVKTKYDIHLARWEDVVHIIQNLREADRLEMCGMYGEDKHIGSLVRSSYLVSRDTSFIGTADGKPICLFGLVLPELLSNVATPWLLGTPDIKLHSLAFLRISRRIVTYWSTMAPVMRNYVDARNTDAIRWLQWVGFQVYYPQPMGPDDLPFHLFEKRS